MGGVRSGVPEEDGASWRGVRKLGSRRMTWHLCTAAIL
jgi:hypothetical protein